MRPTLRHSLVRILTFCSVAAVAAAIAEPGLRAAPVWVLIWHDEFNGAGGAGVDMHEWRYDVGTQYPGGPPQWGTGEVETMSSSVSNVSFDGAGHLVITPLHAGRAPAAGWTSGRIETERVFEAPAGGALAIEASLQQPNVSGASAAGYWPAFWTLGSAFRGNYLNWPRIGELDIMEDVNGLSSEFATFHCGTAPGGPCNEFTGISSGQRSCTDCQTAFHTYRLEQDRATDPEQIRWYVDGALIFAATSAQVDATTWADASHHGFFVLLDVAIGGGFPAAFGGGPTAATVGGVPLLVDYVRVFTRNRGFTDDPLVPGHSVIRAIHVLELRTRIDAVRAIHGLDGYLWSDDTLTGTTSRIRAAHVAELRDALAEVYVAAGAQLPIYTDSLLTAGTTVRAVHIIELRTALMAVE